MTGITSTTVPLCHPRPLLLCLRENPAARPGTDPSLQASQPLLPVPSFRLQSPRPEALTLLFLRNFTPPRISEPRGSTQTYQPTTTHLSYYEASHRLRPGPPGSTPTYSTTWLKEETRGGGAETPPPKGPRKVLGAAAAAAADLRHAFRCQRRDL